MQNENVIQDQTLSEQGNLAKSIEEELKFVCQKIEEAIEQYHNTQREREELSQIPLPLDSQFPLKQKLDNYKELSQELKYKLENVFHISRIKQIESEIKKKRDIVKQMQKENNTISKMNKRQAEGIEEYQNKFENKKEFDSYMKKLEKVKAELKQRKETFKECEGKIREQKFQISDLQENVNLIRDNIEYKKKMQIKEVQDHLQEEKEEDIYTLETQQTSLEEEIALAEKQFKNDISNQNDIISKIRNEIKIIEIRIKEKEQSKRINELKMKELKKINSKKKNTANTITNKDKENPREGNQLKGNKPKSRTNSRNNVIRPYKMEGNILNNMNKNNDDYANYSQTSFKIKNKKQKPFEINKFNKTNQNINNVNKEEISLTESNDMLVQIENLKNDIQKTLMNTHLGVNNIKRGNEKYNNGMELLNNNDISEIKPQVDDMHDFDVNIGEFPSKENQFSNNTKRKPFDNINFK